MNYKDMVVFGIVLITIVFIASYIWIMINGGIASDEDTTFCKEHGGTYNYFFNIPLNACSITDCNQTFDGITYCNSQMFNIRNNKFISIWK